jgi:1-acyl-sn-glycerol-3-phosphate acyltransferase
MHSLELTRIRNFEIHLSDWFYNLVYSIGAPAFFVNGRATILHRERAKREGAYILAATHLSPYDVALLIRETPRVLDFVSIVELFRNPLSAWFLGSMGAFPLDRSKRDSPTVRIILDHLARGRVIAMFPEGSIRRPENSVLNGGPMKPGVARIAQLANVPIVPCVVLGGSAYHRFWNWMPLRRTRYGINYGEAILPPKDPSDSDTRRVETQVREAYHALYEELLTANGALKL